MDDLEELRALEERLLRPEVRRSAHEVAALLDDDFREVGASGKTYDKAQALAALKEEAPGTRFELSGFEARLLEDGTAVASYRVVRIGPGGTRAESLRRSVWTKKNGRWRMLSHRGTPVAPST